MKLAFIALVAAVFLPSSVFAAGFAKESIFLSQSSVTEGDSVLVHTIVSNDAATTFTGTLTLAEADAKIGTVPVTLTAQEAQAVSVSWKPTAGSHTLTATLTDPQGELVEKTSATFRVNEKPQSANEGSSDLQAVSSSEDIQNKIAGISPGAAQAAAPVFSTVDSARTAAVSTIDKGIDWAKDQTAAKKDSGAVLGAETSQEKGGLAHTAWTIGATIILYILTILRFLIASAGIFYPVFAVLFLYALWRLYKRMRRPKYPQFN